LEALSTGLPVVAVRGVLPPEMERQCGVYVTERESYAATLVRDYSRMQATPCGTELVVDHSEGAAVWSQLQSLTQRGMPLPKPARLARYWRLRPLRDFVREKAGMRGWIRGVRRRLGAWGGLP
jgi:hypothetical protein